MPFVIEELWIAIDCWSIDLHQREKYEWKSPLFADQVSDKQMANKAR